MRTATAERERKQSCRRSPGNRTTIGPGFSRHKSKRISYGDNGPGCAHAARSVRRDSRVFLDGARRAGPFDCVRQCDEPDIEPCAGQVARVRGAPGNWGRPSPADLTIADRELANRSARWCSGVLLAELGTELLSQLRIPSAIPSVIDVKLGHVCIAGRDPDLDGECSGVWSCARATR